MHSINGQASATIASIILNLRVTFRLTSSALTISTNTVHGETLPTTATSGLRRSHRVGLLTPMAIGSGSIRGDGLGSSMSLGAMLHSTTGDGFMPAAFGDGRLDRFTLGPTML